MKKGLSMIPIYKSSPHPHPSNRPKVAVIGRGLAAVATVAALRRMGLCCDWIYDFDADVREGPPLVLNDISWRLLQDLFPDAFRKSQLGHPLRYRRVAWGVQGKGDRVVQLAWVCLTSELLETLSHSRALLGVNHWDACLWRELDVVGEYPFVVIAASSELGETVARTAQVATQQLQSGHRVSLMAEASDCMTEEDTCAIETLSDSWLFYAPVSGERGFVQCCLPSSPDRVRQDLFRALYESRLVGPRIGQVEAVKVFPSQAFLKYPFARGRFFAVGRSGIGLDPVSGEGTPFSLRMALLAAASIRSILDGAVTQREAISHFNRRLVRSFAGHLEGCLRFYREGFPEDIGWRAEGILMAQAFEKVRELMAEMPSSERELALSGFELRPVV